MQISTDIDPFQYHVLLRALEHYEAELESEYRQADKQLTKEVKDEELSAAEDLRETLVIDGR